MKIFNNITEIVRDDLQKTIKKNGKVSVAAACFSMYAYQELKQQLDQIDEFRFIFTSPTFIKEKAEKQKRELPRNVQIGLKLKQNSNPTPRRKIWVVS